MTFHSDLTKHLGNYKRDILEILEPVLRGGKEYHHILPPSRRQENIVPSSRERFWRYATENELVPELHRDFHHLNSSQAFAFNLFFPVFENQPATNVVLDLVGFSHGPVRWQFEAEPDDEEKTNFDVLGDTGSGRLLVEIKFTEQEFGTCKLNDGRKDKRSRIYRPRLIGKIPALFLDDGEFSKNYQLLRNLSHLKPGDRLLLIVPKGNTRTFDQAVKFRDAVLGKWKEAVLVVSAEELIDRLARIPAISTTISEIRRKYLLT